MNPVKTESPPDQTAENLLLVIQELVAEVHPQRPHIQRCQDEGEDGRLNYRQLKTGAARVAAGLMPFHLGAFTVAAEAGVPVIPVAIALRERCRKFILQHCGEPDIA